MTACLIPTWGDLLAAAFWVLFIGAIGWAYLAQRRADRRARRRRPAWPPLPPR